MPKPSREEWRKIRTARDSLFIWIGNQSRKQDEKYVGLAMLSWIVLKTVKNHGTREELHRLIDGIWDATLHLDVNIND